MEIFANDLTFMESIIDNRLMKLNYQFDRLMMEHKENINSIELKVLMENGTDDDLCALYTMEAEEVKEKGQGVLAKIITAVKNFFRKLRETLFGKKPDENKLPDQIEVPDDPDAVLKDGNNLLSQIKGFISGHKVQIAVGAAATAGAVVLTKKKIIPYTRDLEKYLENQEKVLADASNPEVLARLNPEQQEILKSAVNKVKGNGSRVSKIMNAIRTKSGKASGDDYEEIRNYKKNMDNARQREDAKKREAKQAEKDAWTAKSKDEKIQYQSQRTRAAILQKIKDLQQADIDDKLLIKNRAKDIEKIEKKSGDKGSFAKWFGLNKHTKEGERITALKRKLDSGEISGAEVDEYSRLVIKHGQSSGEMTAELNKAKAEMQAAIKRRAATADQIKKLSEKIGRAVKQQGEAAERQAAHVQATAANESVEDLICTANSEVDYFINHIL